MKLVRYRSAFRMMCWRRRPIKIALLGGAGPKSTGRLTPSADPGVGKSGACSTEINSPNQRTTLFERFHESIKRTGGTKQAVAHRHSVPLVPRMRPRWDRRRTDRRNGG